MAEIIIIFHWLFYAAALSWIIAILSALNNRRGKVLTGLDKPGLPLVNIVIPVKEERLPAEYLEKLSHFEGIENVLIGDDAAIKRWVSPRAQRYTGEKENDKVVRQQLAFKQLKNENQLVFFVDADIRLEQSIIDEARLRFSNDKGLGLLFFAYNQVPVSKSFYAGIHAYLFNLCTIPLIRWFGMWGKIPGALGGTMVMRIGDVKRYIDWEFLKRHLTEDTPMAKMIRESGLSVQCAVQTVQCVVPALSAKDFQHIWHRWFIGSRYYIPAVFYGVAGWMFCLHAGGLFVLIFDLFTGQSILPSISIFFTWHLLIWVGMKTFGLWYKSYILAATIIVPFAAFKPLLYAFSKKHVYWQGRNIKMNRDGYVS
ncbi:MAG: hypothetical protein GTO45_08075 [Candidatus Aminicenantes bacterium]|nr:hypothetical protein [Candidatus Aminicenantes bacterium]NIM78788.1 hypothetical protein [Candidatus Aminicenantes bacterium]NIN18043.1 hypothetical protein [Candidatus Aminicenantes bacterium]NIN41943.1 hypothetical protein [Candidatus Aminicenantes bacterium]NIN84698.1 hypothetical protein [Candidatus Aminicenantes bacterium]